MARLVKKSFSILAFFCLLALPAWAAERVPVFVSIVPQKYFVERIGKNHVDVQVMVSPGASPATYEPRPGQMAALSKAVLYFAVGVPFEQAWLSKFSAANPAMKIIHTDQNIEKLSMTAHTHDEASGHTGPDPHIWLSPPLVKKQVTTILNALQEADPDHAAEYQTNAAAFVADIDALDKELAALFADAAGSSFLVFHPSWGYFAHAYGLIQVPVEIEGKEPKPGQLRDLIEYARDNRISVILVQPQFSSRSAQVLAREIGGKVAVADPLAGNWPENLRAVARTICSAVNP